MMFPLKEYRLKHGFSQKELSEKSGVSRSIISGLESGRVTVTTNLTMRKIANALGETVESIFFSKNV